MQIKQHAKQGNISSAKVRSSRRFALHVSFGTLVPTTLAFQVIAKEVVNSNKAINRMTTQKAHMLDMEMALKHQLGALTRSYI